MFARIFHLLVCLTAAMSFFVGFARNASALIPLATVDFKRIAKSAEAVQKEISFWKKEIEANLNIVKMIQNGGYAAAAGALFSEQFYTDENGKVKFNRYGEVVKDTLKELENTAEQTQYALANEEKKKEQINEKLKEALEENQQSLYESEAAAEEAKKKYSEQAQTEKRDKVVEYMQNQGISDYSIELFQTGTKVLTNWTDDASSIINGNGTDEEKTKALTELENKNTDTLYSKTTGTK